MAKYWKEAATVIIASKTLFPKEHPAEKIKEIAKLSPLKNKDLKENQSSSFGFKVLTLKRSAGSSFMPSTHVFPGGATSAIDSAFEWMQIFESNGVRKEIEELCSSEQENNKNLIFRSNSCEGIPKTLSLRITGIRETFEECGVLLCRNKTSHSSPSNWASYISGHELFKWQKKVQTDPSAFVTLCRHFECYPDVWSLNYWSNWLTPNDMPKRFNTAFFLALLDHMPPVSIDDGEIHDLKWCTPNELLELCKVQKITLPPPQFYELSTLNSFNDIEELSNFVALQRGRCDELWMPVHVYTTDGGVSTLPGDDSYPSDLKITTPTEAKKLNVTMKELRKGCDTLHRIEFNSNGIPSIVIKNLTNCRIVPRDFANSSVCKATEDRKDQ